jgi:plastocyanin
VRRKALPLIAAVALAGVACGGPGVAIRSGPTEDVFVPQVVDSEDAAGRGVSIAVDAEGNPHLAYLAFESNKATAEAPEQEDPNAPQLPAVRHAHLIEGLWTRSVVADDQQALGGADATAIAVDGDGVHHVAWTVGDTLFYSNNAEGSEFSKPDDVSSGVAGGLSMAVGADKVPRIAFVERTGAEGPGALIVVASLHDAGWAIETAAEAAGQGPLSTAVGLAGDRVLIAYGSEGRTFLARSGTIWASEVADEDGGMGISMDVDDDGNPHLSYVSREGQVKHAHSIGGGPWEISTVADSGRGTTTIAVDDEGIHHVAWQTRQGLSYASNPDGEFRAEEVPGTKSAELPRVGAGAEGTVYLAWFEPAGSGLILAIRSDREPILAMPTPSPGGVTPTGPPTGPPPCEPSGTTLTIAAPPGAAGNGFDTDCLAAPAGEASTIEFDNSDPGQTHNVGIYESQGGTAFFQGELITAPDTTTYDVEAVDEPGQYFFQCDVHPTTMTGTFVVQ